MGYIYYTVSVSALIIFFFVLFVDKLIHKTRNKTPRMNFAEKKSVPSLLTILR